MIEGKGQFLAKAKSFLFFHHFGALWSGGSEVQKFAWRGNSLTYSSFSFLYL